MTELIWEGKYKDGKKQGPVRIALPVQTVETVNESAQDRRRNLELFASGRETEWRNRLVWGDKKYVLPSLLQDFAGKVNLIYIDPPFDTGANFSFTVSIPNQHEDSGNDATNFTKEPSVLEQKAYRDTWGQGADSYLHWIFETCLLLRDLLAENGSIYVHVGPNVSHYVKLVLDEVFAEENYRNEVIWQRHGAHNDPQKYGIVHDAIFFYTKGPEWTFNPVCMPYDDEYIAERFRYADTKTGRKFWANTLTAGGTGPVRKFGERLLKPPAGRHWAFDQAGVDRLLREDRIYFSESGFPYLKQYLDESPGKPCQSIWPDVRMTRSGFERVAYTTQKPESLLERIIRASSNEGDLVLDCFAGSGTTAVVAENLKRRWIACDLSRFAIHTTRKRLLAITGVKPFVVQNLGKYERQAWQAAEFPTNGRNLLEEQCQREAAYRGFIIDLYHAKPVSGYAWLHGTKAGRMVHVAAVDAPVTQADVKAVAREAWKAVGSGKDAPTRAGVDILGWEFALELNETAKQAAAESHVDVSFKKIPREVLDKKAVEQGDVRFFELGALFVNVKQNGREVSLKLTDFVIPTDDIPDEARRAIKHWSQLIDYWAVDWDFKGDTFHNQWQTYRTRKDPKISLDVSYLYQQAGRYTIVVKVIDILGNDTTKTLEVSVR